MKTFDKLYKDLQNADNSELNNIWQEAKKENEKVKNMFSNKYHDDNTYLYNKYK